MGSEPVVHIVVRGEPVPWARAGRQGMRTFTPAKQREAMKRLQFEAQPVMGDRPPLNSPLYVEFDFCYPWPVSMTKKFRALPWSLWRTNRPDGDNLVKLVKDALNSIVWRDDALIVRSLMNKVHDEIPRIEIRVWDLARLDGIAPEPITAQKMMQGRFEL